MLISTLPRVDLFISKQVCRLTSNLFSFGPNILLVGVKIKWVKIAGALSCVNNNCSSSNTTTNNNSKNICYTGTHNRL